MHCPAFCGRDLIHRLDTHIPFRPPRSELKIMLPVSDFNFMVAGIATLAATVGYSYARGKLTPTTWVSSISKSPPWGPIIFKKDWIVRGRRWFNPCIARTGGTRCWSKRDNGSCTFDSRIEASSSTRVTETQGSSRWVWGTRYRMLSNPAHCSYRFWTSYLQNVGYPHVCHVTYVVQMKATYTRIYRT